MKLRVTQKRIRFIKKSDTKHKIPLEDGGILLYDRWCSTLLFMKIFFTRKRISIIVITIGIIGAGWFFFFREGAPVLETVLAQRMTLERIVSVTGKVQALDAVDLSFEKGGRISAIHVSVGDRVKAGDPLLELDHADLSAQLAEAEAGYLAQQAKLQEMERGTRAEEIIIAEAAVASAEQTLADASGTLTAVRNKATADMTEKYDAALNALAKSVNVANGSLYTLTDLQLKYFSDSSQESIALADAKARAVFELLGAHNMGRATNDVLSTLNGGTKALVAKAQASHAPSDIEQALAAAEKAVTATKTALDTAPVSGKFTSTESANLQTEKNNVAGESVTLAGKEQAIAVQKVTNESAIGTAQTSVNTAKSALTSAKAQLALKQAGATAEQIAAQAAAVQQASAAVQSVKAQRAKAFLSAPIAGIVTKQDAKIGQIATANTPIISLISDAGFEIEARIPEADIALVKKGDSAKVTLDAYGSRVVFPTTVIAIDPAETVVEGVSTYTTTFAFLEKDERIRSGMTANIDVITDRRENVIAIPRHSIIGNGNGASVMVVGADDSTKKTNIQTGLYGSDGNVEIIEGLAEGDRVLLSPEQ